MVSPSLGLQFHHRSFRLVPPRSTQFVVVVVSRVGVCRPSLQFGRDPSATYDNLNWIFLRPYRRRRRHESTVLDGKGKRIVNIVEVLGKGFGPCRWEC